MEAESLLASEDDPVAHRRPGAGEELRRDGRHPRDRGGAGRERCRPGQELPRAGARARALRCRRRWPKRSTPRSSSASSAAAHAESFARGLITGEPDNVVALAGTTLGDLFVFGDIRDAVREGSRYASGEKADELVLGLSVRRPRGDRRHLCHASARRAPARVGLSVVKAARKTGRHRRRHGGVDRAFAARGGRLVGAASAPGPSLTEPAIAVRAAREAVKVEQGRRTGEARERRRPGADQGRDAGRARRAEARRKARARWRASPSSPRRRAARRARS